MSLQPSISDIQHKIDDFNHQDSLLNTPDYDPTLKPANLELAQEHAKAKGVYRYGSDPKHSRKCACCGLAIEGGQKLPMCADTNEFCHYGSGYTLYFEFYKDCMVLLLILGAIVGVYSTYTNFIGNSCTTVDNNGNEYCLQDYIGIFAISNNLANPDILNYQLYLTAVCLGVFLIYFQYMRYKQRKFASEADAATVTPSDFTIQVDGLTKSRKKRLSNDLELTKELESYSTPDLPIKVVKICRVYDINSYVQLAKFRDDIQTELHVCKDEKRRSKLHVKLYMVQEKLKSIKQKGLKLTRTAFVTLEKAEQAYFLRKKFHKGRCGHHFNKLRWSKTLEVNRAPEPTDINWENLGQNAYVKIIRRAFMSLIIFILVWICCIFIVYLNELQLQLNGTSNLQQFLNFVISFGQNLMDPVICTIISILSRFGRYTTKSNHITSTSQTMTISKFINNAITIQLAKLYNQNFQLAGTDVYGPNGINANLWYTIVINVFIQPFQNLLSIDTCWRRIKRRSALKQGRHNNMTQKEAHELFEGEEFGLDEKYGFLITSVQIQCMFATALPFTIFVTLFGLYLNYWVDKYIFLRKIALPPSLGTHVQDELVSYIESAAFFLAFGELQTYYTLMNGNDYADWNYWTISIISIMLAASISIYVLPTKFLNECCCRVSDQPTEEMTFNEAKHQFLTEYDIENPITRKEALAKLLQSFHNGKEAINDNRFEYVATHNKDSGYLQDDLERSVRLTTEESLKSDSVKFEAVEDFLTNMNDANKLTKMKKIAQLMVHKDVRKQIEEKGDEKPKIEIKMKFSRLVGKVMDERKKTGKITNIEMKSIEDMQKPKEDPQVTSVEEIQKPDDNPEVSSSSIEELQKPNDEDIQKPKDEENAEETKKQ